MKLNVLVPRPDSRARAIIAPHSAIVSDPASGRQDTLLAYYEGNVIGAENLTEYYDRMVSAAGRLTARYPTVAMAEFPADQFELVAVYDTELQAIVEVVDGQLLEDWSGEALERIAGTALPVGPVGWDEAATEASTARQLPSSRPAEVVYRTRAGQTLVFDVATRSASVSAPPEPDAGPSPL